MPATATNILSDAIARNSAIVLSLPSAGMLRHHKSRFLAEEESGFWIEGVPNDDLLINQLIESGTPVGISFRAGPQKVSFVVPMLGRNAEFRVNAQTVLNAIQLIVPTDVKAIQRRSNYRVRVPQDAELFLRVWRIPEHFFLTDKPNASAEIVASTRDISIGGVGLTLQDRNGEPPKVIVAERLRLSLRYKDMEELILEGRVRFLPPPGTPAPVRCGVQFKKLENNLEGRQALATLTKIVGELQRDEVRRTRLGLKSA